MKNESESHPNVEAEIIMRDIMQDIDGTVITLIAVQLLTGLPLTPDELILADQQRLHLLLYNWFGRN